MTGHPMPWTLFTLPSHHDPRGNLIACEAARLLPFAVKRLFWIFGIPPGTTRGGHAHRTQHQALICLRGAIECSLDDGHNRATVELGDAKHLLHLPPLVWGEQRTVTADALYLVLASDAYDNEDYLRTRNDFLGALAPEMAHP
jgi:UDP-2-acetamido-3-amino-2,3-dideoxy-glucuronate N-acetyltransferase